MQKSVAVIDDSADDGDLILRALRSCPEVGDAVHYLDPGEALTSLTTASAPPHLILVDIKMPGLDGFAVIERLRGNGQTKGCPLVALSSSHDPADVSRAHGVGANSYLVKPVDFDQLKSMLQSLCREWLKNGGSKPD